MNFPELTIVFPVYNGARTAARLLDSLMAQTYTDFQVIIIDNASEDETESLCKSYEAKDPRFKYFRRHKNMGITASYTQGMGLALFSDFVSYVGHDDSWEPTYAEACVGALKSDPRAVLAYSTVNVIDDEGQRLGQGRDEYDAQSDSAATRFMSLLCKINWCTAFYGIIRAEAMRGIIPLLEMDTASADNLLLAHLALLGTFIQLDEPLFNRKIPTYQHESFNQRYGRIYNMGQHLKHGITLPFCAWVRTYCNLIKKTDGFSDEVKDDLCRQTVAVLLKRYDRSLSSELHRAIELVKGGWIHKNWEDELLENPPLLKQGAYKALDYVTLLNLARDLDYAFGLMAPYPELSYARALVYLMMGRKAEAAVALNAELARDAIHSPSLELRNKLRA